MGGGTFRDESRLGVGAAPYADEFTARVRLARVYLDSGKPADAERVAREALFIDVQNEEARGLLLD